MSDLEPLVGRWKQVIDAPRHIDHKVEGEMTIEWLRGEKVLLQRSIAEEEMFPEGVTLIMLEEGADTFTVHYFDSRPAVRKLEMSFEGGVWKWWREAQGPDDFDQRYEGKLSEDGSTIEGATYLVEDGEWIHDFDLTYSRAPRGATSSSASSSHTCPSSASGPSCTSSPSARGSAPAG